MRPVLFLLLAASCAPAASPSPSTPAPSDSAPPATAPSSSVSPVASTSPAPPSSTDSAPPALPPGPEPSGGSILVGDINAPPHFDPKPTLVALKPKLLDCFNQARASNPSLHGKLTLRIQVSESGAALSADADPSGNAYDPALVKCLDAVMRNGVKFPRPGGVATVAAPLLFRP